MWNLKVFVFSGRYYPMVCKSFLPPFVHSHLFNWVCDSISMASGKPLSFNNDGTVFLYVYWDNSNIYVSCVDVELDWVGGGGLW